MMDLSIGFNEMQWLVLVIFSSIISSNIFFKIGLRAGIEEAIELRIHGSVYFICDDCGEPVIPHKGNTPHFEHKQANPVCKY